MSDVLSQDEIDKLLQALKSGELSVEEIKREEKRVKPYDFKRPSKFSKEHIRVFDMIHENFARSVSTYLSGRVRTFVSINLASIDQITYEEFIRSLPAPAFIVVFSAPEFVGSAILEMNLELFYTILDLILGGPGIPNVKRPPSEIEISIMRKEVMNVLANLAQAWSDVYGFSPTIESIENNPQFVQIAPPTEMILLISMFLTIGKTEGFMNICWPSSLMEPFMDRLSSRNWFKTAKKEQVSEKLQKDLTDNLNQMNVVLSTILGETVLTVREILELEVGDVIRLKSHKDEDVAVQVQGRTKFLAKPGTYKGYRAVKITKIVEPEVEE
ncbi:flagellar motor switch protein FliM [Pseudothermotoga sp.]|uniref:flagellar motor switch protein FliM n=1 Tax=Pseudothermotoga sp. TaxID=2033661 RepID=UPI0031F62E0D